MSAAPPGTKALSAGVGATAAAATAAPPQPPTTTTTTAPIAKDAAAPTPTPTPARAGRLYVCGRVAGAGNKLMFPLPDRAIDNAGHCAYPHPLVLPDPAARFTKVRGERNMTAALEARPQAGSLWCWVAGGDNMRRVIPGNVASFAVGVDFAVAALHDGTLHIVGADMKQRPFTPPPPKPVTCVSASELNIAIVCGDAGEVWTLGPCGAGNGHGEAVAEWRQLKLLASSVVTATQRLSSDGAALAAAPSASGSAADAAPAPESAATIAAVSVAQGSIHGAAVTRDGRLFCWGDGLSGTLGTGERTRMSPPGRPIGHAFPRECGGVVAAACTTAQLNPKRVAGGKGQEISSGQEGPRCHAVTADGALWISGTTHKGMGADCLYKTLSPDTDLLSFYRVGGAAQDVKSQTKCPTGGAEDFARKDCAPREVSARRLGMASADDFGANRCTGYLTEPGLKIVSTQPTHIHSVAVSADGRCFAWGCGSDGRTGLRAFMRGPSGSKRLMKCYVSSPSVVEALEDKVVIDACACRNFTVYVVGGDQQ